MVPADCAVPWLRTLTLSVRGSPVSGLGSSMDAESTTRSGPWRTGPGVVTVTRTAAEQLLVVSLSPETASTQAP